MNLTQARSDLARRLSAIDLLTPYRYVPAKPEVPCATIDVVSIDPHSDLEASPTYTLKVTVLVQFADWEAAQSQLDDYADPDSPKSVKDAVEFGEGGPENMTVTVIGPYGQVDIDGVKYGICPFTVEVLG